MRDIPYTGWVTANRLPPGYEWQRNHETNETEMIHKGVVIGARSNPDAARLFMWDRWAYDHTDQDFPRDPPHDGQGYVIEGEKGLERVQSLVEARVRRAIYARKGKP